MPQRKYSKTRTQVAKPSKRIILPIGLKQYNDMLNDSAAFRKWLDQMIAQYPELFPADIKAGYRLHDLLPTSVKLPAVQLRRIRLYQDDAAGQAQVFTIAPSEVLPYMTGSTDEVEKALFLRRFGVPFWGLTYVFGRDDSYWERLSRSFGSYAIVGTTLKDPHKLPEHLLADEKHVHFNGQTAYIATTVAQDCLFGASLALNADEAA